MSNTGSQQDALNIKQKYSPQHTHLGQIPTSLDYFADELQAGVLNRIKHEEYLPQMDHKTMMSIFKLLPKTMSMNTQIERTKAARLIMTLVQNISLENIPEWFAEAYMVSDLPDDKQIDVLIGNTTTASLSTTLEAVTAEEDESEYDSSGKRTSPRLAAKLPEGGSANKASSETTALFEQRKRSLLLLYGYLSDVLQKLVKFAIRESPYMKNKIAELGRRMRYKGDEFKRDALNRNLHSGYILLQALGGMEVQTHTLMVELNSRVTTSANKLANAAPHLAVRLIDELIDIAMQGDRANMLHISDLALHMSIEKISENSTLNSNGLLSSKIQRNIDSGHDFNIHDLSNLVREQVQTIISKRSVQKLTANAADAHSSDAKTIAALTEQLQKLQQGDRGRQNQKRGPPSDEKLKEMSETPCRFGDKCKRHMKHPAGTPQACWYKHGSSLGKSDSTTKKIGVITQSSDGEGSDSDHFYSKSSAFGQRDCGFCSSDSEGDDL